MFKQAITTEFTNLVAPPTIFGLHLVAIVPPYILAMVYSEAAPCCQRHCLHVRVLFSLTCFFENQFYNMIEPCGFTRLFFKTFFVTTVFYLFHSFAHSQTIRGGVLLSAKDGSKVPYATIKVLHKPFGTFSDDNGVFEINASLSDSLFITSIGYADKIISISDFSSDTVFLSPHLAKLPDVIVAKREFAGKEILGFLNVKSDFRWGPSGFSEEFAQKICIPFGAVVKILKVSLSIDKFNTRFPVLVHIYSVDKNTGFPAEELLQKPYLVSKKNLKGKRLIVDLSEENIFVCEDEIFVGFQWLGKISETGNEGLGTLLPMTQAENKTFTFSRTMSRNNNYAWFPLFYIDYKNRYKNNPDDIVLTNTMFSIEVERYK
jgi:hypothetical protein